ncbi:MAG: hypothetical protein B2I17_02055 [Thermoplasmatales archaeon B_DKE]|nr:MAG: hypothetical protein B2I17_02055 [Thermoplasmatales archaeon B_DKE]
MIIVVITVSERDYDVIVVGAGIMGLASAYHLKIAMPDKSIVVLEKESSYSQGNSGRSVSGYRDFFSTVVNQKLSKSSIKFYSYIQKDLGYDIQMKNVGYMFLMSMSKFDSMKSIITKLQSSTDLRILDRSELSKIHPLILDVDKEESRALNLQPIEVGVLGRRCGVLEIEKLSSFYYEECRRLGVEFNFKTQVNSLDVVPRNPSGYPNEPFLWQDKLIGGISTNRGDYSARRYVLTTGAWTGKLLDRIGVDSHMKAKKRFVYQIGGNSITEMVRTSYGLNDEGLFPFLVLPSHGVYLRPHPSSGTFWISTSGTTSDQEIGPTFSFDSADDIEYTEPSDEYFVDNILPVLRAYMRDMPDMKITGKWTGYYSLNSQDKTPYIFAFLNAIVATGGSGAGLMKSDSIGRVVASIASGQTETRLFDGSTILNSSLGVADRDVGIETLRF